MNPLENVTVVIRYSRERTGALSARLLQEQVPARCVHVIEETPFSRAVCRTFEIGLSEGLEWTLAADADVLVTPSAVGDLVSIGNASATNLFEIEGRVFDKLFGGPRSGGLHLFRTSMLSTALGIAEMYAEVDRPESHVINAMAGQGCPQLKVDTLVGMHDFEQSHRDLYRKGFVHAQKHGEVLEFLRPMWVRLSELDGDFKAALLGMAEGFNASGVARTDVRSFDEREVDCALRSIGLSKKGPMRNEFSVAAALESLNPEPEFLAWDSVRRKGGRWKERLRRRLRRFARLVPSALRRLLH